MQLKRPGRLGAVLGALTANLLAAGHAHAQSTTANYDYATNSKGADATGDTGTDVGSGLTRVDSGVLFYQEDGGRVRAIEPTANITLNSSDGRILSLRLTADTLTGATPNGAVPWTADQTFTTPAHAPSTTTTVTRASGGAQLITLPGVGTVVRQYTTPAGQLPLDPGFQDQRYAVDVGYSVPLGDLTRFSVGGGYSQELDYRSYSANFNISRDFNQHNTTLTAAANFEYDQSSPIFGVPDPLTPMSGNVKGPDRTKTVDSVVLGLTQAVSRNWLLQLNYSYGLSNGYQTDPYRIISVVDGVSGAPVSYLYESRPERRVRQSLYLGNKIAFGSAITSLSLRGYHDDWGITSTTAEISEHIPLPFGLYVEPSYRYYKQGAADFYRHYLVAGQPLPQFASSDGRLGDFNAQTTGIELGHKFVDGSSLYLRFQEYAQHGQDHPPDAIGGLADLNLFDGVHARSWMLGYSVAF